MCLNVQNQGYSHCVMYFSFFFFTYLCVLHTSLNAYIYDAVQWAIHFFVIDWYAQILWNQGLFFNISQSCLLGCSRWCPSGVKSSLKPSPSRGDSLPISQSLSPASLSPLPLSFRLNLSISFKANLETKNIQLAITIALTKLQFMHYHSYIFYFLILWWCEKYEISLLRREQFIHKQKKGFIQRAADLMYHQHLLLKYCRVSRLSWTRTVNPL